MSVDIPPNAAVSLGGTATAASISVNATTIAGFAQHNSNIVPPSMHARYYIKGR